MSNPRVTADTNSGRPRRGWSVAAVSRATFRTPTHSVHPLIGGYAHRGSGFVPSRRFVRTNRTLIRRTRMVLSGPAGWRSALPGRADIVAKVENRRAIIFPPKDDVTGDRCTAARF